MLTIKFVVIRNATSVFGLTHRTLCPGRKRLLAALGILTICAATGCGTSTARLMKPADGIGASADAALVTFLRPTRGNAAWDPIQRMTDAGYLIFDCGTYVGELQPKRYIQYRTTAGEHAFILMDQNIGAIKANLVAGKSYFVNVKQGLVPIRPAIEVLKPSDPRIDEWLGTLKGMTLDPLQWQEQTQSCDFPTRRPVSPEVCKALRATLLQIVSRVRAGRCKGALLNGPTEDYCESTEISPDNGR